MLDCRAHDPVEPRVIRVALRFLRHHDTDADRTFQSAMTSSTAGSSGSTGLTIANRSGITFCHLLNDVMQALLPAIYPMLKSGFAQSFGQIGLLTLIFQVTASLLQPMVGLYTDRRPQPYSLPLGMACSLLGMVTLAFAPNVPVPALLAGAALLGIGSSIFHPEWRQVVPTVSHSLFSRLPAMSAVHSVHCWPRSSSYRKDVVASTSSIII